MTAIDQLILSTEFHAESAYDCLFEALTTRLDMPILCITLKAGSTLCRSRDNEGTHDFWTFDDLTYPPAHLLTNYSRANKPFQQIFYGSDNFATTLAELLPYWGQKHKTNDVFYVTTSHWELLSDVSVGIIPDEANERLMQLLRSARTPVITPANMEHWKSVNNYFRAQGVTDTTIYKFTSAYCNALVHNALKVGFHIDGILYTSTQDTSGWNLALSPVVADKCLVLRHVIKHSMHMDQPTNGRPNYDNFTPPVQPLSIDHRHRLIKWNRRFAFWHRVLQWKSA
jgi:hypothetical protein